jgi:PST family polysaccharide transporter
MVVALWILVPWRPRPRLRREHLRELLGFGAALTGVGVVAALTLNVDKLLIGHTLGPGPLGLYSLATRLPELLLINLTIVAGQVLFPAFAAVDRAALGRAFVTSLRYAVIVVLPVGAFLGVLAEPLIVTAFGDQWGSAAPAMRLFTVMAILSPITIVCGTVWKATGKGRVLLRLALLELVALIPAVAIFVSHGITAVAACQAGSTMLVVAVSLPLVLRTLGLPSSLLAGVVGAPLLAAATMAGVLLAVDDVLVGPLPVLAVGAVLGAAAYGGVMWMVARSTVRELVGVLRPMLRGNPPPEPAPEDGAPTPAALIDKL